MKLTVSCIQMDIVSGETGRNIARAELLMDEAMQHHPDVLVLPELWTTGHTYKNILQIAEPEAAQNFMQSFAKHHVVNIVGGSLLNKQHHKTRNTAFIYSKTGTLITQYSKVHLFQRSAEHLYFQGGEETGLFHIEGRKAAIFISYDIRFPEWMFLHSLHGAEIVFVVAQWPKIRLHHWRSLLISRAIENQCYIVACNRCGQDDKHIYAGHSLIINPWGEIIAEGTENEGVVSAEIDTALVKAVRRFIPVWQDRRLDLYIREKNKEYKNIYPEKKEKPEI
ncbi:carbon-nitrogen family hydrolase [Bacillus sp. 165]|uniref:carbon-nitrogen family hydrolase n=1 Tax=Bacillus sp. 165 TaxID=1529117 RepID=UPI001ADA25AA|nr:carbon-nitrogen family hydrolase [Bacillus sp. 165]MBO9128451.1 carbon-nitrogen family hydrolase [Bacillus sp. 165]